MSVRDDANFSKQYFMSSLVPFQTCRANPDDRDKWKVLLNRADSKEPSYHLPKINVSAQFTLLMEAQQK
jgi:hypothetical protein